MLERQDWFAVKRGRPCASLAALLGLVAGPAQLTAQTGGSQPTEPEIVVWGLPDILVNGRVRNCTPLPDDPLNKVNVSPGSDLPKWVRIVPAGRGNFEVVPGTDYRVTGPDFWQRTGFGIDKYSFRVPADDRPMCVGASTRDRGSFAGFNRITDIAPFRGKRVRFTAWVATGGAQHATFFLVAGTQRQQYNGGNTNGVPFSGDHGWTPVLLETGPVSLKAEHVSYGFHLQGPGDMWVYDPRLEAIDPVPGGPTGDVITIGTPRPCVRPPVGDECQQPASFR
jgi:hypothetical protein